MIELVEDGRLGAILGFCAIALVMVRRYHKQKGGLVVKKTSIKGCDFDGLFADRAYLKGEVLCKYTGKVLRTKDALRLGDKSYLMRLGEQCYVDSRECMEVQAR
jgi:hypothetical protein